MSNRINNNDYAHAACGMRPTINTIENQMVEKSSVERRRKTAMTRKPVLYIHPFFLTSVYVHVLSLGCHLPFLCMYACVRMKFFFQTFTTHRTSRLYVSSILLQNDRIDEAEDTGDWYVWVAVVDASKSSRLHLLSSTWTPCAVHRIELSMNDAKTASKAKWATNEQEE